MLKLFGLPRSHLLALDVIVTRNAIATARPGSVEGPTRSQHVPSSSLTSLAIICCTHCSRMIASLASYTALLSSISTPSKVGGTVGFFARKASDSGVGIVASSWELSRARWGRGRECRCMYRFCSSTVKVELGQRSRSCPDCTEVCRGYYVPQRLLVVFVVSTDQRSSHPARYVRLASW